MMTDTVLGCRPVNPRQVSPAYRLMQMNGVQKDVAVDLARSLARSDCVVGARAFIGCSHFSRPSS